LISLLQLQRKEEEIPVVTVRVTMAAALVEEMEIVITEEMNLSLNLNRILDL
jgi:hypothetical protein